MESQTYLVVSWSSPWVSLSLSFFQHKMGRKQHFASLFCKWANARAVCHLDWKVL